MRLYLSFHFINLLVKLLILLLDGLLANPLHELSLLVLQPSLQRKLMGGKVVANILESLPVFSIGSAVDELIGSGCPFH